jgi:hypothetical protein
MFVPPRSHGDEDPAWFRRTGEVSARTERG